MRNPELNRHWNDCECCCYQCWQQEDMERMCASDWSSTDIHLAIGMEVHGAHVIELMFPRWHSSSTSSGGVHKKGPQASITCCSLWTRALTTHGILPLLVLQDPHGLLNAHSVFLKRSAPTCNGDECGSPSRSTCSRSTSRSIC